MLFFLPEPCYTVGKYPKRSFVAMKQNPARSAAAQPALPPETAELLTAWFAGAARPLPWRETREPYRVWLSEIMLQQTRAEAVAGYYRRFLEALPTVRALAAVEDERLMKLWEGLGYYARARNLKKAARIVVNEYGGRFPDTYEGLRALPGVGDYTAGAVASICFGLPEPAVDGNVLRVVSRLAACPENVDRPVVRRAVREALRPLYSPGNCSELTQSLMELGACVCVPNGAPCCGACPLAALCKAHAAGRETAYPVRGEKRPRRAEERLVLVLRHGPRVALQKRPAKGLLAGLWEFPNRPLAPGEAATPAAALAYAEELGAAPCEPLMRTAYTHVFTHVEWRMTAFCLECAAAPEAFAWVTREELETAFALPSAFRPFADAFEALPAPFAL